MQYIMLAIHQLFSESVECHQRIRWEST